MLDRIHGNYFSSFNPINEFKKNLNQLPKAIILFLSIFPLRSLAFNTLAKETPVNLASRAVSANMPYNLLQQCPSSLASESFALSANIKDMTEFDRETENKVNFFRTIVSRIKDDNFLDEVDALLAAQKSFHYTFNEVKSIHAKCISSLHRFLKTEFYQFLKTDPFLKEEILKFSENTFKQNKENYQAVVKPYLAKMIMEGPIGKENKKLQAFLAKLTLSEKELIDDFLQGKNIKAKELLLKHEDSNEYIQDVLAIYKELIINSLPQTLQENHKY